jgi:hypothetical protein
MWPPPLTHLLGGLHRWFSTSGEEEILLTFPGMKPRPNDRFGNVPEKCKCSFACFLAPYLVEDAHRDVMEFTAKSCQYLRWPRLLKRHASPAVELLDARRILISNYTSKLSVHSLFDMPFLFFSPPQILSTVFDVVFLTSKAITFLTKNVYLCFCSIN